MTRHVLMNYDKLSDKSFKAKYGAIYTPVRIDKGLAPLIFVALFLGRRFF